MAGFIFFVAIVTTLSTIAAHPFFEKETSTRSIYELGDKFQGDIVLTPEQKALVSGTTRGSRTGLLDKKYRWPKNSFGKVILPYTFQSSAGFSKH
jgi:hypothetical protein